MTALALLAVAGAMGLIRIGWGGRRGLAGAGWALALAAAAVLTWRDGAWGLALATVAAMGAALALVLYAAWTSPARAYRAARAAPSIALPHRASGVARRLAVFVLAVPVAFAAAQWLAYGLQAAARAAGMGASDATAAILFLQPVLWLAIMTVQMTRAGPVQMLAAPALAALAGTALWGVA
ncbi:hypothetical protein ASG29_03390 [Sphingomonas sp. Leaf412]|uniref:hypothetical protein n=1 Tax=Sphingomonas sp. Leaf412 TaxID=1736370 RepID=UPI0006FB0EF4|nr:hypothetical protein [Sphingomonas sp. Leaf412]KQT35169.1 hypothetical protein ASG29_03390 [Sphingomonas sp. Leaf412]